MSKQTVTTHICDRCKQPFKQEYGEYVELLGYQISVYDPSGDGGTGIKNNDFCAACTQSFFKWLREGKTTPVGGDQEREDE